MSETLCPAALHTSPTPAPLSEFLIAVAAAALFVKIVAIIEIVEAQIMKNFIRIAALSAIFLCVSYPSFAGDSEIVAELKRCAVDANVDTRVACYEALGSSLINADSKTSSTEPVQESSSAAMHSSASEVSNTTQSDMPDSLGGGLFADKAGVKAKTNRGHVISCKKSSDRKWFYIFANGQAWKQVDSRKRRYKECDFWVTIVEDSFGFKMIIDGQEGKIRIDRRR